MPVKTIAALAALALIAIPVNAMGKSKPTVTKRPSGNQQYCDPFGNKGPAFEARGVVKAVDIGAGNVTLTIGKHGASRHARASRGVDVTFLVNCAKLKVRDTNRDGKRDLSDVKVGARAEVLAKLPRSLSKVKQPLVAKQLRVL